MNTIKRILDRSRAEIIKTLLDLIRSGYEVMVFELTEKGEMQILQPFTSDEQLIRQAVDKASGSIWVEHAEDVLAIPRYLLEGERNRDMFYQTVTSRMYQFETRRRLEATLTALLSVMNVIKDLPGRKPVLLISGGFPYYNIDEIQVAKINDPFNVLRKNKLTTGDEIFRQLITFANSYNITFYSLYSDNFLRYVLPDISLDNFKMTNEIAEIKKNELYALGDLATDTGGVAMLGADKFQDFRQVFQSDLSSYYEISYVPPRKKPDGQYHKITVKTKLPDIILRYRQGYFDYNEDQKESLLFASAALNPSLFRDIPFSAKTIPVLVGPNRFILWMTIALPVQGFLLGEDETREMKVIKVGLSLIDEDNQLAHSAQINMPLKLSPELRRRLARARYFGFNTCSQEMEFKKNRYRAVVALYDQDSRVISTVESSLEVSGPSKEEEGSIVNAVFGQVTETQNARLNDFSFSQEDGTLQFLKHKFYPLGANELAQKERVALYLQVRGAQDEGNLDLAFSASQDGKGPIEVKAREMARSRNKKADVWNAVFELNLSILTSGDYVLQISRQGRTEEQKTALLRLPLRLL
jgi:VWFA-related protein